MVERLPAPETYGVACERIRCICALHSCSVTSNARTHRRNNRVGGRSQSKHQIPWGCCGWDLVPDDMSEMPEVAATARVFGFWCKVESDHVHLQSIAPGSPVPVHL